MKLFIPNIGTKIQLTSDWLFTLHPEYRNHTLYEMAIGKPVVGYLWGGNPDYKPVPFTLPAGIVLSVDRIYIKKPSPEYNSMTFRILKKCIHNPPHFAGQRFWVKLDDANNIEGNVII